MGRAQGTQCSHAEHCAHQILRPNLSLPPGRDIKTALYLQELDKVLQKVQRWFLLALRTSTLWKVQVRNLTGIAKDLKLLDSLEMTMQLMIGVELESWSPDIQTHNWPLHVLQVGQIIGQRFGD